MGLEWHHYMKDCLYRGSRQRGWPDEISSVAFVLYLIGIFYIKILPSALGFPPVGRLYTEHSIQISLFIFLYLLNFCATHLPYKVIL